MILQLAISSCLHILQYDSYHLLYPHIPMAKMTLKPELLAKFFAFSRLPFTNQKIMKLDMF